MSKLRVLISVSLAGFALAGCSWLPQSLQPGKGPDYRSQGANIQVPSLEVPPDLTSPTADDRFVIPSSKSTSYSSYNRDRNAAPAVNRGVLPKVENARIERQGDTRWLVVKASPDKLWPLVKEFWTENGFILKRESAELGMMETDWAENRAKIPQDIIRNTLGRVLDNLYSTGERDRFRTRIERSTETGASEIYISHRGVEEVYTSSERERTMWQARPIDHALEAEMLGRLMLKLGVVEQPAANLAVGAIPAARASYNKADNTPLVVNEPFDRAWRRIGLALDRSGFTVEDRDRSKGLFFVRYIDPDTDMDGKSGNEKGFLDSLMFWRKDSGNKKPVEPPPAKSEKGFLDKLAFWRKDEPALKPAYRIYVSETSGTTNVRVQDADGKVDNSPTAKRILALLLEQLK